MIKEDFLRVVEIIGKKRSVRCKVLPRGAIRIFFKGDDKELSVLQAVCRLICQGGVPHDWWYVAHKLMLNYRAASNIDSASRIRLKKLNTPTKKRTRRTLFQLLNLPEERM